MVRGTVAVLLCCLLAFGADFEIVRDGKPRATIVISSHPTHSASFSAWELQYHIQKITGATLPVVTDASPVKGNLILVGESALTRSLGLSSQALKEQEYIIKFLPNALVLMGKDEPQTLPLVKLHGGIRWEQGRFGKGLAFNAKDTYLTVEGFPFSDEEGSFSLWIYPSGESQGEGTLLRIEGYDPWTYHILSWIPPDRVRYSSYDGKDVHSIESPPLSQGWHHILATYSLREGKMCLYIDGEPVGETSYAKTSCAGAPLKVGAFPPSPEDVRNAYAGIIDEIKITNAPATPRETLLKSPPTLDEHTVLLIHLDEGQGIPKATSAVPYLTPNPPSFYEYQAQGTSYAVHDFLERFCDVRWYSPGEIGMVYPQTKTLRVKPKDIKRRPAFLWRSLWPPFAFGILENLWGHPTPQEVQVFLARLKAGGEKYACNHSFYGYYDRFLKTHPEWFAKGYEGQPPQMCYSSPGFINQVVQDARDYFDGKGLHPGAQAAGDYFGLVPMDNNFWCKCEECQRQLDPAQRNAFFANGYASNYIFGFVSKVAKEVQKSHPGKFISCLAYWEYSYYPKRVKLPPNVSVQMCLHIRNWPWDPPMMQNDLSFYRDWVTKEKGRRLFLWLYYCFPEEVAMNGGFHCFPGFFAHFASKQFKMFAKDGIRGVFLNGLGELVDTYVTLKLLDDPNLNVDALLDEFFSRYYGPAGEPLKKFYRLVEETYCNPLNYPEEVRTGKVHVHQTEEMAWGYLGTEERMRKLGELIEEAKRLARGEAERKRVEMWEEGIWRYMVEGRERYLRKKEVEERRKAHEGERQKLMGEEPPSLRIPISSPSGGNPEGVDWSEAVSLGKWWTVDGYPTERRIEGKIIRDQEYLYIRLEEPLDTKNLANSPDIWSGDDWEIFLSAERKPPYYQIGVAPDGRVASFLYRERRGKGEEWVSNVRVTSKVEPDRWLVLVALPLSSLPISPNGECFANFYRASFSQDDLHLRELLAWSPNFVVDFHNLDRMGRLILQ